MTGYTLCQLQMCFGNSGDFAPVNLAVVCFRVGRF